jgi:uncharacterized membrane protein HdeD (DUF308 family)
MRLGETIMKTFPFFLAGGALLLGGVVALLNPLAATFTAEQIAGWFFLLSGGLQVFAGLRQGRRPGWWPSILLGGLGLVVGLSLLLRPLEGIISLTLLVAVFFLMSGAAKIGLCFALTRHPSFWFMLLSGAISILLGAAILAGFPASAGMVLGTLLAIDLLTSGVALLALGLAVKARQT